MTGIELFLQLAELIPAAIEHEYPGFACCILATRIAIEIANYYGIEAEPVSCRVVLYNDAFSAASRARRADRQASLAR